MKLIRKEKSKVKIVPTFVSVDHPLLTFVLETWTRDGLLYYRTWQESYLLARLPYLYLFLFKSITITRHEKTLQNFIYVLLQKVNIGHSLPEWIFLYIKTSDTVTINLIHAKTRGYSPKHPKNKQKQKHLISCHKDLSLGHSNGKLDKHFSEWSFVAYWTTKKKSSTFVNHFYSEFVKKLLKFFQNSCIVKACSKLVSFTFAIIFINTVKMNVNVCAKDLFDKFETKENQ